MDEAILNTIFKNSSDISSENMPDFERLIVRHPYCQFLKALHLRNLKNNCKFDKELKLTAAYSLDREVLFNFIKNDSDDVKKVANYEKKTASNPYQEVLDNKKAKTVEPKEISHNLSGQQIPLSSESGILSIGKSIDLKTEENKSSDIDENADLHDKMSFQEWLSNVSQPSDHSKANKEISPKVTIKEMPAIKADKSKKRIGVNLAKIRNTKENELMTETLADMYTQQGKYAKAIKAYEILMIKNPKKSTLFAEKIKNLKTQKK